MISVFALIQNPLLLPLPAGGEGVGWWGSSPRLSNAKSTFPKGKTPARSHWGSRFLAGVHINPSPEKKRSTRANATQKVAAETGCQVSGNDLLAQVVRQFIEANRAPKEAGQDF
jgi:hypothetical protein